jgi:DNA-binding response OmpR family regulator
VTLGESRPISVLYVDDDAGIAPLVERFLGRHGYHVTAAPDGAAGLA